MLERIQRTIIVALGVPAPTVTGHVAEDQDLGFTVFREGAPEGAQQAAEEPAAEVSSLSVTASPLFVPS